LALPPALAAAALAALSGAFFILKIYYKIF